ncbi:phosphoribosyltransferase family protein [Halomonas sp. HK25]|uniref:phosphoribosyltransferase family protein n=1 Tax=Halomonas sp. HK25 TaxID=3394321 RepID=UPI0039FD9D75
MIYKSYKDLGNDIHNNIHQLQGEGYDLVVGIPRSGMIPAYMIALLLNIHCTDLNAFLKNARIAKGHTRKSSTSLDTAWEAKKVLLVDDSLKTGNSMQEAVEAIQQQTPHEVTRLAIYVEKIRQHCVDLYFEALPGPRIYQWNLFHQAIMHNSCLELDGVLCQAPGGEALEDEDRYRAYLAEALPLVLPTYRIGCIVTARPERYREQTVQWLETHKIEYERLEMRDTTADVETDVFERCAQYKANCYQASTARLFIEKQRPIAARISALTGRPVLCLDDGELSQPGMVSVARSGKRHLIRMGLIKAKRRFFLAIPDSTEITMRNAYRRLFR